jgi:hypothetical protein
MFVAYTWAAVMLPASVTLRETAEEEAMDEEEPDLELVVEAEPASAAVQPVPSSPLNWPDSPPLDWPDSPLPDLGTQVHAGSSIPNRLCQGSVRVEHYPNPLAGAPTHDAGTQEAYQKYGTGVGSSANPYAPFCSKLDWEVAHWAKLHGPGSTAFTELLKLEGVCA